MAYNADGLWRLLKEQGRSITWLAKATGYNRTYLHLMRNGSKPVTEEFAGKASAALGISADLLFVPVTLTEVSNSLLRESAD